MSPGPSVYTYRTWIHRFNQARIGVIVPDPFKRVDVFAEREEASPRCCAYDSKRESVEGWGTSHSTPIVLSGRRAMKISQLVRACVVIVACSIVSTAQAITFGEPDA